MKGFGVTSTTVAAATWFAASAVAQLDPIVIKVGAVFLELFRAMVAYGLLMF